MRGSMALDMIVKFVIILVVAALVIGLFIQFQGDAKDSIVKLFKGEEKIDTNVKTVNQASFSAGQVAQYIESCYDKMIEVPEVDQKDTVCFVLMAQSNFNTFASQNDIVNSLPQELKSRTTFNTNLGLSYLKIEFRELGDKIVIS